MSVRNQNVEIGMPSVHASYMLFGGEALAPLALVDGAALTGFRTAAVSALATTMLARPDASRLVLFGAGVQAESHLTAMAAIRPLRQLTVVNGNAQRAGQLIELAGVLGIEGCGAMRPASQMRTLSAHAPPRRSPSSMAGSSHREHTSMRSVHITRTCVSWTM